MKIRNKIIIIAIILISIFIVIPSTISLTSTFYCNSIYPVECVSYSISLLPDFGFMFFDISGMTDVAKSHSTIPTTCNDILGKPDGECFVNAFKNCEYASIKNISSTFEGDPIFLEAHIEIDGTCSITYSVDTRDDKWRDPNVDPISVKTCIDAQLDDDKIIFQCGDGQHRFSLQ